MKFSMKEKDGRYQIASSGDLGDWIIKTPSTKHKYVPLNEYTAMRLAEMAGINISDIELVPLSRLDKLPQINFRQARDHFSYRTRKLTILVSPMSNLLSQILFRRDQNC